jgi:hypothetical protein
MLQLSAEIYLSGTVFCKITTAFTCNSSF